MPLSPTSARVAQASRATATNQVGHRPVHGGAESRLTDQGSEDDDAGDRYGRGKVNGTHPDQGIVHYRSGLDRCSTATRRP